MFFTLSRLFIVALWPPAGKRLISWLLFVMFKCVFVTFPCNILGQVWYLIVSIPDLCRLSYFGIILPQANGKITFLFQGEITFLLAVSGGITCQLGDPTHLML